MHLNKIIGLTGGACLLFLAVGLLGLSPKASAASCGSVADITKIPACAAPASVRSDLARGCDVYHYTSTDAMWVSKRGAPTQTSFEVPYGATSVSLQLNYLTAICKSSGSATSTQGSLRTYSMYGTSSIDSTHRSTTLSLPYTKDYKFPSASYAHKYVPSVQPSPTAFSYNSAPLTQNQTITIHSTVRGTLKKSGGYYVCQVVGNEFQHSTTSLHNFTPAGKYCYVSSSTTQFSITVSPQGSLALSCSNGGQAKISMPASQTPQVGYIHVIENNGAGTSHSYFSQRHMVPYTFDISKYSSWQKVKVELYLYDTFSKGYIHITTQDKSIGSCASLDCGDFQMTPASIDPYTKFSITVAIHLTTSSAPPGSNKLSLQIDPIAPATWSYSQDSTSVTVVNGKVSKEFTDIGPTNQTGHYKVNWTYTNSNNASLTTSCGYDFGDTDDNFWVTNKPYFNINGGDIQVGNGFASDPKDPSSCSATDAASIVGWNQDSGSYIGAGTEYASYALGVIDYFASAQNVGSSRPSGLAFSNTYSAAKSGVDGTYGGNFGGGSTGYGSCIPDYYDAKPSSMTGVFGGGNVSSLGSSGQNAYYSASGNLVISGGNINPGERVILYVNGNVQINGDIRYVGNMSADKPTYFEIVAKGNIYVSPSVGQLDGAYIAQGDGGSNNGTFYTCTSSNFTPVALDNSLYDNCNNQLTINGAVVANNVELLRSYGSIGKSNVPAETINYNPSVWIAGSRLDSGTPSFNYDSITSLPPVL